MGRSGPVTTRRLEASRTRSSFRGSAKRTRASGWLCGTGCIGGLGHCTHAGRGLPRPRPLRACAYGEAAFQDRVRAPWGVRRATRRARSGSTTAAVFPQNRVVLGAVEERLDGRRRKGSFESLRSPDGRVRHRSPQEPSGGQANPSMGTKARFTLRPPGSPRPLLRGPSRRRRRSGTGSDPPFRERSGHASPRRA